MNTTTDLPRIPLSALHLSPLNARKVRPKDVDSLAASIAAHGLLQNLTVTVNDKPGEYEVVAGGRRLAAMQQLAQEGRLPEALARDGIPCLVIEDNDVAHEASTAENTLREAMHPADQYEAFRRMIDAGKPIADVAAHFGTSEHVVRQRLKLANVHPQLLQIYREGGMQLDQLQALALTDDHEQQRKAWFGVKEAWQRTARDIRERITKQEVGPDNPLVKFVGIEAYEQAGGPVRRDMFSGAVYLGDRALLDKLALDKLEVEAERYRSEGWSWVEVHLTLDYEAQSRYRSSGIEPKHEKPTAADREQIKEIDARRSAIEAEQEAADEYGPEHDALELEDSMLLAERRRLAAGKQIWPDDAKAKTGVLIWIDRYDGLRVACGRLKPGSRKGEATSPAGGATPASPTKAAKPQLSRTILSALSAHRSVAAAHHVAQTPTLATCLLIERMLQAFWPNVYSRNALQISWTAGDGHRKVATDFDKGLVEPLAKARKALNDIPRRDTLEWLLQQSQEFQQNALATLVALAFDGVTDSPKGNACVDAVHKSVGIDMAKYWSPMCDSFLARIPAALVVEAVSEACGKDQAAKVSEAKGKEARAAAAAKLLAGTGWLPKPLRGACYQLRKQTTVVNTSGDVDALKKVDGRRFKTVATPTAKKAAEKTATPPAKKAGAKKKAAKKPTAKKRTGARK